MVHISLKMQLARNLGTFQLNDPERINRSLKRTRRKSGQHVKATYNLYSFLCSKKIWFSKILRFLRVTTNEKIYRLWKYTHHRFTRECENTYLYFKCQITGKSTFELICGFNLICGLKTLIPIFIQE